MKDIVDEHRQAIFASSAKLREGFDKAIADVNAVIEQFTAEVIAAEGLYADKANLRLMSFADQMRVTLDVFDGHAPAPAAAPSTARAQDGEAA